MSASNRKGPHRTQISPQWDKSCALGTAGSQTNPSLCVETGETQRAQSAPQPSERLLAAGRHLWETLQSHRGEEGG